MCIDGHNTPVFEEKFVFSLIEGLREISVAESNYFVSYFCFLN